MYMENNKGGKRFTRGYLLLELVVALGILGTLLSPLIRYSNMLVRMKRGDRTLYKKDIMEFEKISKLSYLEILNLMERENLSGFEKIVSIESYGKLQYSSDNGIDWSLVRDRIEFFPVTLKSVEDGWEGSKVDVAKGIGVRDKEYGLMKIILEKPDMESCQI